MFDDNILKEYRGVIIATARGAILSSSAVGFEDLCQVGEMAVLRSIKSYDPSCGKNIKSYICACIRQDIYNEAARFLGIFTVDHRVTELAAKANKMHEAGHSDHDICEHFNKSYIGKWSEEKVRDLRLVYGRRYFTEIDDNIEDYYDDGMQELLMSVVKDNFDEVILQERFLNSVSAIEVARQLNLSLKRFYELESSLKSRISLAIRSIA